MQRSILVSRRRHPASRQPQRHRWQPGVGGRKHHADHRRGRALHVLKRRVGPHWEASQRREGGTARNRRSHTGREGAT
eukprot:scaffold19803_cov56-Isochrysis_galbana.AAC.1